MAPEPTAARPPTIRTVAARAGVSKSLVSLVLQNSPHVSEAKRQAVLKAVAELGYRPDPVARSLAERRTRTIGVVIDDLSNPWYVELLDGLRPVLHEHGLRPLLADGRTEPDAVQALADLRVDGLVLVGTPTASRPSSRSTALAGQIPTVVAGTREPRLSEVDVVANDDYRGGSPGHAAPARTGPSADRPHRRRGRGGPAAPRGLRGGDGRRGRRTTVRQRGLDRGHRTAGRDRAPAFLPDRPTAILAANDLSAVGVLAAADELELRVPEDLSVVGYDNTVFARLHRLSLTTIDGHIAEVGQVAGRTLTARIGGDAGTVATRLLSPVLVVRSSTGAVPENPQ